MRALINLKVFLRKNAIMTSEPALLAVEAGAGKILAAGREAEKYEGMANCDVFSPFKQDKISDYAAAVGLFKSQLKKTGFNSRLIRPKMLICIPADCTDVEKKAYTDIVYACGAKEIGITAESLEEAVRNPVWEKYPVIMAICAEDRTALLREKLRDTQDYARQQGLGEEAVRQAVKDVFDI